MTRLRVIQVGLGGWGRDWARTVVRTCADVHSVACVDTLPAALATLQDEIEITAGQCFSSLDAALATVEADAVLITAALPGHVPVALAALEAGKHVLIEKPFAPSLADAQRVVDAAAERGLIAMISQNYRFYPAPQAVKHLIAEHALGPVDSVRIAFRKYANTRPRGTPGHYALPDPLLMDMAIHHFDLLRMVLGQEPQTISCHAWNPPWSNFVEPAAAAATITFDGGAVAQYSGSWASTSTPTLWAGEWTIECADGEIVWTSRNDRGADEDRVVVRRRGEAARRMALPALPCIDRSGALTAFAHAIQTGQTPESSARDNLGSLALSLGAIEAARTGQPQAIGALMSSSAALDPA